MLEPVVLQGLSACSFEPAVADLGDFIIRNPFLFRPAADLLLVFRHPNIHWEWVLRLLRWYTVDPTTAAIFCRLLKDFYSCSQKRLNDRRGDILEYILWRCTPRNRTAVVHDKRHRCYLEDTRGNRIGQTRHDLDIGILGAVFFEGYECKANVSNFLRPPTQQATSIKCTHRRKLGYLCRIKWKLLRLGIEAQVYLAGFNSSMTHELQVLAMNRLGAIDVLDATQIAQMLGCP